VEAETKRTFPSIKTKSVFSSFPSSPSSCSTRIWYVCVHPEFEANEYVFSELFAVFSTKLLH
jgi:hypothetical protein